MDAGQFQYKGEKFSAYWDPKEEILFLKMWGTHTEKDAQDFNEKIYGFFDKMPGTGPMEILVDVSKQEKTSHEARRTYTQAVYLHSPRPTNAAICGGSTLIRIITNFITTFVQKKIKGKNIKCFAITQEGLRWLKEMKAKRKNKR